jgi:hypothetical protein
MHPHLHQLAAAAHRDEMLRRADQHRLKTGAPRAKARRRCWTGRIARWRKPRRTTTPVVDLTTLGALTDSAVTSDAALVPRTAQPVAKRDGLL